MGVVKIAGDGNAAPVAPDESWIEVEADGTIVATPPVEATPGTYQVEIQTPSGVRETVTVEVTPDQGQRLALAQQVAREHRGALVYRSRPGHTVFTLQLPFPADDVPPVTGAEESVPS